MQLGAQGDEEFKLSTENKQDDSSSQQKADQQDAADGSASYQAPMPSQQNIEMIKQAVLKSRQDFANRQKVDMEEVLKRSEQDYMASILDQVAEDDIKQVIAQSIREQQAREDEENKKLEDEFFQGLSANVQNINQAAAASNNTVSLEGT